MKNVFVGWGDIEQTIRKAGKALLLFDFDGTLSQIERNPGDAQLDERLKPLLAKLLMIKNITLGIVSGRALFDIEKRVGLKNIIYAGNHGLEAHGNGIRFTHPRSESLRKNIEVIMREASQGTRIRGLFIENKGPTGSIHYRNVAPRELGRVLSLVNRIKPLCERKGFCFRQGKKVFDIIPELKWGKGAFVQWLEKETGRPLVVYTGDDATDEDVFRAMKKEGISIRVGELKGSAASYYLQSQRDMPALLKRLIDLWN